MAKDLKPHIGIFGRRNSGKSSLINVLTGQNIAIVSNTPGTTTDPVKKSVEIFGIGPAILIDTAGIDDEGSLGNLRIEKTKDVMPIIDCAILVFTANTFGEFEQQLIADFKKYDVPYLMLHNKKDLMPLSQKLLSDIRLQFKQIPLDITTHEEEDINNLVQSLKKTIPQTAFIKPSLFKGLVKAGQTVVLVTPIDSEAPEGRMILPQVMAIRDVLDQDCISVVLKETALEKYIQNNPNPALVVTDSQAFGMVSKIVGEDIPLTSFSIVFSRIKGDFQALLQGTPHLDKLQDGDKILILESCTHHVSCEDIGQNKLPNWIKQYSGKNIEFEMLSGLNNLKSEISNYAMVIQCGGCVATRKQIINKLRPAIESGIPVSNYGMCISYINGIFQRVTSMF